MNNVLNKLIELGYVSFTESMKMLSQVDIDIYELMLAEKVQRALFDECGKREIEIRIRDNELEIYDWLLKDSLIHEGDTSRESFLKAFCKVVGI